MTSPIMIPHNGGPCPIPSRKAGEYGVKWKIFGTYEPTCDAIHVAWEPIEGVRDRLIAYYLID